MTRGQIEYAKLLESRRASKAQEALTKARDDRAHSVALGTLQEQSRHNLATESLGLNTLSETVRSNIAREGISQGTLDESVRANKMREFLNAATLRETNRSNLAREELERVRNVETARHNQAVEYETGRSNRANEGLRSAELAGLNQYRSQQIQLGRSQLSETIRSNLEREAINRFQNSTNRMHIEESQRHNMATETETQRHNVAQEVELNRSNKAQEDLSLGRNWIQGVDVGLSNINDLLRTGVLYQGNLIKGVGTIIDLFK